MGRSNVVHGALAVGVLALAACGGPKPKPVVEDKPKLEAKKPEDAGAPNAESKARFTEGVAALEKGPEGFRAAVEAFEAAVEISPKYQVALLNLAYAYERLGRHKDAAATYRRLVEQKVLDYRVNLALGRALLLSGEPQLAITEFESVLRERPEDLHARNNLAAAYIAKGDRETALRYVKEVLAVQPKNVPGIINLGLLYLEQQRLPLALLMFNKAIGYDDKNARAHNNLGLTYFQMNLVPLAVIEWEKALALDPTMDEARLNLASVYLDYLDYQAALDQFAKVRDRFPNHYEATVGAANAAYGTGDHAGAAKLYIESLAAKADNPEVLLRVGKIHEEQLGKPDEAVSFYQRYIDVANPPADAPIRATVKFLSDPANRMPAAPQEPAAGAGATEPSADGEAAPAVGPDGEPGKDAAAVPAGGNAQEVPATPAAADVPAAPAAPGAPAAPEGSDAPAGPPGGAGEG